MASESILIFRDLNTVYLINLSHNRLTTIYPDAFANNKKLELIDLSHNRLTTIYPDAFANNKKLELIDLSHNRLTTIYPDAFDNNERLKIVNLERNLLSFSDNKLPFMQLKKLQYLNLSNNNLSTMPSALLQMNELTLDLRSNNISSVKYSDLLQTNVNFTSMETSQTAQTHCDGCTYLDGNPLMCDCSMYKFFLGKRRTDLANVFGHSCAKDPTNRDPCHFDLPWQNYPNGKCPAKCRCTKKDQYFVLQISCAGEGLESVPVFSEENESAIVLNFTNNALTKLPKLQQNSSLIVIDASYNRIATIEAENLPLNLRILDVTHNNIQTIAAAVLQQFKMHENLEIIFLLENRLLCDCSDDSTELIEFAKSSTTDLHSAKCTRSTDDYCILNCISSSKDACVQRTQLVSLVAFIILALAGLVGLLYHKQQKFMKVWLYAHNCCLWWVDEEYVDRELRYDAFLSYSQKDEEFAHHLVNELENGSPRFRLCFHERDFVAGEEIHRSIIRAVVESRRVIIILSEDYLNSTWATTEFHLALRKSIAERRKRLIVVKHGDFKDLNITDETIRWYVTANTYIQSDHRWFWEHIRYAMPHVKE